MHVVPVMHDTCHCDICKKCSSGKMQDKKKFLPRHPEKYTENLARCHKTHLQTLSIVNAVLGMKRRIAGTYVCQGIQRTLFHAPIFSAQKNYIEISPEFESVVQYNYCNNALYKQYVPYAELEVDALSGYHVFITSCIERILCVAKSKDSQKSIHDYCNV